MKWRNFPAWLKGGIIGLIIGILILLGNYLYYLLFEQGRIRAAVIENPNLIRVLMLSPFLIANFLLFLIGLEIKSPLVKLPYENLFISLFGLIIYFIIGAFIGWLIGKIKSKKKV